MNPNPTKTLWSRKDVAALLDITPDQVRKNEARWGLDSARRDLNRRCVRYASRLARSILQGLGFIE